MSLTSDHIATFFLPSMAGKIKISSTPKWCSHLRSHGVLSGAMLGGVSNRPQSITITTLERCVRPVR